jgi:branched-chain amino acid transport system ATP-binding protein
VPQAPLLTVRGLRAAYGQAEILHGIDFDVAPGEVLVLLGRNGAGKSTTMKALIGLVPPRGEITFAGQRVAGRPPHAIARLGLGYVPEERRIFTGLSVIENLEVGRQRPRDAPPWTPERLFVLFPNLGAMRDRPGGRMSGGEQQMLTIARTLMGNPRLLLLDEPSEGLAPVIVEQLVGAIAALKQAGVAILLAEQNFHFARQVADRAAIIESGALRWTGSMSALAGDQLLQERYLAV